MLKAALLQKSGVNQGFSKCAVFMLAQKEFISFDSEDILIALPNPARAPIRSSVVMANILSKSTKNNALTLDP